MESIRVDMKKMYNFLFVFILSLGANAQKTHLFPQMSTNKLDDQIVVLPDQIKGKYSLLGLAYSKEAELELATWYQPVYETFIHKDKGGVFETESYDIHLFLIPMFTGVNQMAHSKVSKEMKEKMDKTLWPYILLYKGDLKNYKDNLAMDKKEHPYFYVLNKKGEIVYKTFGRFSEDKLEQIEKVINGN